LESSEEPASFHQGRTVNRCIVSPFRYLVHTRVTNAAAPPPPAKINRFSDNNTTSIRPASLRCSVAGQLSQTTILNYLRGSDLLYRTQPIRRPIRSLTANSAQRRRHINPAAFRRLIEEQ